MQHHVSLLALGLQIRQTLPCLQILSSSDACRCRRSREIIRLCVVMALGTKHTIYPAVLMLGDTHIIDIGGGNHIVGHRDGLLPEAEIVDAVGRLSHSEIALTICTLHTDDKHVLPLPLNST